MKYQLVIGAIFKNEADVLEEWVRHHLNRGVEHIYLINDYSQDNYAEVLEPYIEKGKISLYNNTLDNFYYGRQAELYNRYFKKVIEEANWISIIDIDEFLWSPHEKNLASLLENFSNTKIEGIIVWSLVFGGDNIIKQPKNIIKSFIKRQNVEKKLKMMNLDKSKAQEYLFKKFYYKQIVSTRNLIKFGVHTHLYKDFDKSTLFLDPYDVTNNLFRINHYKTQSKEKWDKKMNQTDVNWIDPVKLSDIEPFREHEYNLDIKNIMQANNYINYRKINDMYFHLNKIYNEIEDLGLADQTQALSH